MRFKSFLDEASSSKYGSATRVEDAADLILTMPGMLRSIRTGNILYRSQFDSLGYAASVIDSTGTQRQSLATNNLYQIMMDASPSLSQFPSRTRSIICSTAAKGTGLYGTQPYIILPFDGTPIAVASVSDFINQEIHLLGDIQIDVFSKEAGEVIVGLGLRRFFDSSRKKFTDIDALDKALADLEITQEQWDNAAATDEVYLDVLKAIKASYKSNPKSTFRSLAKKIMTPSSLDLTLVRAGGGFPTSSKGREVWFEGKALAMTPEKFVRTFSELEEMGNDMGSAVDLETISRM